MTRLNQRFVVPVTIGLSALIGAAFVPASHAVAQVGDWGSAHPVVAVNDPLAADGCPIESPSGTKLYIASTRSGGDNDIWVATRSGEDDEFGAPVMLPEPVNSDAQDFCPTPLRGKGLLFVSTRGGTDAYGTAACGGGDIYFTRKSPATGEWSAPRNLGCVPNGPNGPGTEYGPSLDTTEAGTQLFFSSGGAIGTGTQDIYVSEQRVDGTFGERRKQQQRGVGIFPAKPGEDRAHSILERIEVLGSQIAVPGYTQHQRQRPHGLVRSRWNLP